MQTPSGKLMLHWFSGTPVIIWREPNFHSFPIWLFSIHKLALSAERETCVMEFCIKIAGFGFTFRCMILLWSRTLSCMAKVEEISS